MAKDYRDNRVVHGFMCGVDWQHELGEASGGNPIYASVADLRRHRTCSETCGVVKVEVKLVEWTHPQDFSRLQESE